MPPQTFEIRPGLHIEIQAVPDSVRLLWRIAGSVTTGLFDPGGGNRHAGGWNPKALPAAHAISAADLALIESRLRQYAEARRRCLATQHVTALFFDD